MKTAKSNKTRTLKASPQERKLIVEALARLIVDQARREAKKAGN